MFCAWTRNGREQHIPVLMTVTNCPIFIFEKDYKLSNKILKTLSNQGKLTQHESFYKHISKTDFFWNFLRRVCFWYEFHHSLWWNNVYHHLCWYKMSKKNHVVCFAISIDETHCYPVQCQHHAFCKTGKTPHVVPQSLLAKYEAPLGFPNPIS